VTSSFDRLFHLATITGGTNGWRATLAKILLAQNVRLNSATGYITPKDMLAGRQQDIHAERDQKLVAARKGERAGASKRVRCR